MFSRLFGRSGVAAFLKPLPSFKHLSLRVLLRPTERSEGGSTARRRRADGRKAVARSDSWKPSAQWRQRRFGTREIPGSFEYTQELMARDLPPSFFPETAPRNDVRLYQERGFFACTSTNK